MIETDLKSDQDRRGAAAEGLRRCNRDSIKKSKISLWLVFELKNDCSHDCDLRKLVHVYDEINFKSLIMVWLIWITVVIRSVPWLKYRPQVRTPSWALLE